MKIENEDKPRSLKYNDLVTFVLQGDIGLG
jgi:hypothetical protein